MEDKFFDTAPVLRVPGTLLLPDTVLKLKNLPQSKAFALSAQDFAAVPALEDAAFDGTQPVTGALCRPESAVPDGDSWSLTIKVLDRISITSIEGTHCVFTYHPVVEDLSEKSEQEMIGYINEQVEVIARSFNGGAAIAQRAKTYTKLNQLISFLAQYMQMSAAERAELLEIDSQKERATRFMDALLRQKEAIALNFEMNEKLSDQAAAFYRRQALERQLSAIQDELNAGHEDDDQEAPGWGEKIDASFMGEENKKALREDARRLEQCPPQSQDAQVLQNYLEFALDLPWKKEEAFDPDLMEASDILDARHSGMEKVKERILQHLAVMKLRKSSKGSAILLVGPPGTGKTSLGKSIAQALRRPYVRMALGGIRDESEIRGHRRTYVGAMSGRVLKAMKQAGKTNPVMILDELDKMMAGGFSGDPSAAMLEVLDPEQNDTFVDHYLDLPYDLSDVMFIATANSLDTIPAPLLDRMEVIRLSGYTPNEKLTIARDHLVGQVLEEHGIPTDRLTITDEALISVIDDYTMEAGCRGLKKQLARIARTKAVDLATGDEPVVVEKADLESIFDGPGVRHEKVKDHNPCGVVTGMAWTPVGGEVLYIETVGMPGTGQMILTGQLGDVMKESARISYSVLKNRLPLDTMALSQQDIHIHFPAGATPKDGPSAGITIFTALASLALQKPVDSHLAMTGELSLQGDVLPIGGLKEKLYGAVRAGVTKVLIPWDNRQDLRDVADEVKNALEIIPVKTVEEVLSHTLGVAFTPTSMHRLAAENAAVVI